MTRAQVFELDRRHAQVTNREEAALTLADEAALAPVRVIVTVSGSSVTIKVSLATTRPRWPLASLLCRVDFKSMSKLPSQPQKMLHSRI